MVKIDMAAPKTKKRNGFLGKRITEFDITPAHYTCQRESRNRARAGEKTLTAGPTSKQRRLTDRGLIVIGMKQY